MRLAEDYRHQFTALYGLAGNCRVRVFEPDPEDGEKAGPVVILSDEPGSVPSLRYSIEVVAAEVLLRFALPNSRTAFIEHHPRGWCRWRQAYRPETFELVTFTREDIEHREISPGVILPALSGPEHHPLPVQIVAEFVVVDLLQDLDEEGGTR